MRVLSQPSSPLLLPPSRYLFQLARSYSFTALTDQSPTVWEEVNQSGRVNCLRNVQLQDMRKPVKSAS